MSLRVSILNFLILFVIFFSHIENKLAAIEVEQKWHDFYLITIPKSGTFLMIKLLKMMIEAGFRGPPALTHDQFTFPDDLPSVPETLFEQSVLNIKDGKTYPLCHTNFTEFFIPFKKTHPEYIPIILIRDLRDVLVSCVYFQWNNIEGEIGPSNFDQKLSFLINLGHCKTRNKILNIYRYAEEALRWIGEVGVLICRYEEFIGEKGGGSRELQEKSITSLANALEVSLDSFQLEAIINELFGKNTGPQMPTTFREGKIGSWKSHFNLQNLEAFDEKWHHLQIALGYD